MKLWLDEKLFPLDYKRTLLQMLHELKHWNDQSISNCTEDIYKLPNLISLNKGDDQVATLPRK